MEDLNYNKRSVTIAVFPFQMIQTPSFFAMLANERVDFVLIDDWIRFRPSDIYSNLHCFTSTETNHIKDSKKKRFVFPFVNGCISERGTTVQNVRIDREKLERSVEGMEKRLDLIYKTHLKYNVESANLKKALLEGFQSINSENGNKDNYLLNNFSRFQNNRVSRILGLEVEFIEKLVFYSDIAGPKKAGMKHRTIGDRIVRACEFLTQGDYRLFLDSRFKETNGIKDALEYAVSLQVHEFIEDKNKDSSPTILDLIAEVGIEDLRSENYLILKHEYVTA